MAGPWGDSWGQSWGASWAASIYTLPNAAYIVAIGAEIRWIAIGDIVEVRTITVDEPTRTIIVSELSRIAYIETESRVAAVEV